MRAPLILLSLMLAAGPALAGGDAARPIPTDPAAAAPSPPNLSALPAPSTTPPPRALPAVVLATDMEALAGGGWRLLGTQAARDQLSPAQRAALTEIAGHLTAQTRGRVTVLAEVSSPSDDESMARRASLAAALSVKRALETGGLDGTRIDLRPLGRTPAARDAVDVLPPGVQRDATPRATR
ncbi:hypothetical protein C8P66_1023 [Humitalea rosea]|uniref:OmpA family protein n=1 Tax=Humitalea rosea TaxID=990373 RepID=A0A2W7KPS5_9PROT|nr:hypothetical protein [Humitalea rosea]PZW50315.1 hypothetical protein C8P66_1023 [Humitalea rosea]